MQSPLKKKLVPIKDLQDIRGVMLPVGLEFLQLVVTGPPGAGKTYYINQIGGWPNEGYIDLTRKGWWKDQSLIYRPREINLGLPFKTHREALTVFDKEWIEASPPLRLELERIKILPNGDTPFSTNWLNRYIFEFIIPSPETIYERRIARHSEGYFPVDDNLSLEMVQRQVSDYREVALYLHRAGMPVYIREDISQPPMRIVEAGEVNMPKWTIPQTSRRPNLRSLAGWKWLLFRKDPNRWLSISEKPQSITNTCRLPHDGKSFEMFLGKQRLRFHPEIPLGVKKSHLRRNKNWLITASESCSSKQITGFARIKMGETVMIGRGNEEYDNLFSFHKSVSNRQVTITNTRGDLLISPLNLENPVSIVRLDDLDHREKVEKSRYKTLVSIKEIFCDPSTLLPPEDALRLLQITNKLLSQEKYRPHNKSGEPGGLLELPNEPTPIIIGDLHGNLDNLLKILSEKCVLRCLRANSAYLLFLGDAVHSEVSGEMENMDDSIRTMDLIFQLKNRYPKNVFYLRGNHDTFSPDISKNGFLQGVLMQEALLTMRGDQYVQEMNTFFNSLPYVAISQSFIACHAAPSLEETTKEDIINITSHPEILRHITTKRVKRPNYYNGYSKGDVKKFRKGLGAAKGTPLIVGHTPLDPFGSVWRNVGAIKNHHIIYSAHQSGPSVFLRINNQMQPIIYPAEPLSRLISKLK